MMLAQPYSVVILAGGLATRLRPMTVTIPKSMIEIQGQPFIYHQLKRLEQQGIKEVVICMGYLGEQIQDYIEKNAGQFNLRIQFSYDGDKLLGTAGAIKKTLAKLSEHFFVMYGDSFLTCSFSEVQYYFEKAKQLALMTVYKNHNLGDKSNIIFQNNSIMTYDKTQQTQAMHHIDYGLGIFSKKAFERVPEGQVYDLAVLYQQLLTEKQLLGFEVKERFYEIGSFQGIEETRDFIKQERCV